MEEKRFMDDFRRFFLRGLGALVPTLLTFAILVWSYKLINDNVGAVITDGLMRLCRTVSDEPASWLLATDTLDRDALQYGTLLNEWTDKGERVTVEFKVIQNYRRLEAVGSGVHDPEVRERARKAKNKALWQIAFAKWKLHLLGFVIAIVLVYFVGFFLASFIGRASWRAMEGLLHRVPLIRAIYPHVKQVTDFMLSERNVEFSGVVAIQYPRKGVWSLGLKTGRPMEQIQRRVREDLITVFIPSSPTPITGYVVQIPSEDVIELNMTIDEGLRFTVSGGVIKPGVDFPAPEGADGEDIVATMPRTGDKTE